MNKHSYSVPSQLYYFALSSTVFTFLFHIETNTIVTSNSSRIQASAAGVRSSILWDVRYVVSYQRFGTTYVRSRNVGLATYARCITTQKSEDLPPWSLGILVTKKERQTLSRHAINLFLTKLIKSTLNASIEGATLWLHNKTNTVLNIIQNTGEQYSKLFPRVSANPGHPQRNNLYIMDGGEAFTLLTIVMLFRDYIITGITYLLHGAESFLRS